MSYSISNMLKVNAQKYTPKLSLNSSISYRYFNEYNFCPFFSDFLTIFFKEDIPSTLCQRVPLQLDSHFRQLTMSPAYVFEFPASCSNLDTNNLSCIYSWMHTTVVFPLQKTGLKNVDFIWIWSLATNFDEILWWNSTRFYVSGIINFWRLW